MPVFPVHPTQGGYRMVACGLCHRLQAALANGYRASQEIKFCRHTLLCLKNPVHILPIYGTAISGASQTAWRLPAFNFGRPVAPSACTFLVTYIAGNLTLNGRKAPSARKSEEASPAYFRTNPRLKDATLRTTLFWHWM